MQEEMLLISQGQLLWDKKLHSFYASKIGKEKYAEKKGGKNRAQAIKNGRELIL